MSTVKKYPIDVENVGEAGRLHRQGYSLDDWLGTLPEDVTLPAGARVLDLASGTGTWAMKVARTHPSAQVLGVDRSRHMMNLARTQAHHLKNCAFQQMDIMEHPLPLPDISFDVVHMRLIFSFQTPTTWPALLQECARLLKPGGVLISTEVDILLDYAPMTEKYLLLIYTKMRAEGRLFPGIGCHNGALPMQTDLIRGAGMQQIQRQMVSLDESYGTPLYKESMDDILSLFKLIQPYLFKAPHATGQAELERLFALSKQEMESPSFRSLGLFQTVWGRKP